MATFLFYLCITAFIFISLILIMLILIQKGRGGGLASAFGGAGGNTAFGAKTGDVLTWATSVIFGLFVLLAVLLNLFANYRHDHMSNGLTPAITSTAAAGAMDAGAGASPQMAPPGTPPSSAPPTTAPSVPMTNLTPALPTTTTMR